MADDKPRPLYVRTLSGWQPYTPTAEQFWQGSKIGDIAELAGTKPRNGARHRAYWKVLSLAGDNMDPRRSSQQLHYAMKQVLGLGEWMPLKGNHAPVFIPHSTSFAAMNEEEFKAHFDAVSGVLAASLGVETRQLQREAA